MKTVFPILLLCLLLFVSCGTEKEDKFYTDNDVDYDILFVEDTDEVFNDEDSLIEIDSDDSDIFYEDDLIPDSDEIKDDEIICDYSDSDFCKNGYSFCLSNAVTQCEIFYDENSCPYEQKLSVVQNCSDEGMSCFEVPESEPLCDCTKGLINVAGQCVDKFECPSYITTDETIKPLDTIASFNTLHLGWDNDKDFAGIACVIDHFDIVGLVEVESEYALQKLVSYLTGLSGEKWDYHISPYDVGRTSYKEYYGYVWRANTVTFEDSAGFYEEDNDEFEREPYAAKFSFGDFYFTFILSHIVYGDSITERRDEIKNLIKVYSQFQLIDEYVNDIIIAGDFNLAADDESFTLIGFDDIINAIPASQKTSIGETGLSSAYDNIFLSAYYTTEYEGTSGIVDFAVADYSDLRVSVSDHVPVWIKVKTSW